MTAHPYIPNTAPAVRREMLDALGIDSVERIYDVIPERLRMTGELDLPPALRSEAELSRHMRGLLGRNLGSDRLLAFAGAGAFPHHVPAVCDEINGRAEFLTAYAGETYEDHGKHQAIFEYVSQMAELLEMDVVTVPTYDGYQAAATALRMAGRITGRRRVVVLGPIAADKRAKIVDYAVPALDVVVVEALPDGRPDLARALELVDESTAAVYAEVPDALGGLDGGVPALFARAEEARAIPIASVDPISLGVLAPPASYGARIVCGDIQSLGMHAQFGGAHGGFLAVHDDPEFVMQLPSRLIGLAPTAVEGQLGFIDLAYERTSLAAREDGIEWVGTAAALWGITAGVYLALMGPDGMREVGEAVLSRTRYAMDRLAEIDGLRVLDARGSHFREFAVLLPEGADAAGLIARCVAAGVMPGVDLAAVHPGLGEGLLVCVTEVHAVEDIDRLVRVLKEQL